MGAQFQQGANQLNLQGMLGRLGAATDIGRLGLGADQLGADQQQNILRLIFGGLGQSNALGTPQAQMIQQSSPWGALAGPLLGGLGMALGGPAGAALGSGIGGMFSRGGAPPGGGATGGINLMNMLGNYNFSPAGFGIGGTNSLPLNLLSGDG